MINEEIYEKIKKIISKDRLLENESMKNHTAFKIGGPADLMILPKSVDEIRKIISLMRQSEDECLIIGNGSNLLVSDKGIRGIVLKIGDQFSKVEIEKNVVCAQSGVLLSTLSKIVAKEALEGIEFASGIPGTLGGAVAMNAGAYGGEMKNVVKEVTLIDRKGNIIKLDNDDMQFAYRTSIVSTAKHIVLEVVLDLQRGDRTQIFEKMNELNMRRSDKQPLTFPSAGSTFKRPEGYFAGKLIQDSGLKGLRHGGAMVSDKHSGFIVNAGDASAEDVKLLIKTVQKIVFDKFGVMLETEVKFIGEQ